MRRLCFGQIMGRMACHPTGGPDAWPSMPRPQYLASFFYLFIYFYFIF
jgi:hypothetical protein